MADPQTTAADLPTGADLPIGAVDASGQPVDVAGVTPPEQPPMIDDDGAGELNGEDIADLQVQGGE